MTSLASCCTRMVNQNKWPTLLHDRADVTTRYKNAAHLRYANYMSLGFALSGICFFEKMWFCHLFSKYDIFKRSLNSLNYYYLIFLSRINMLFILYAFCHLFIHTHNYLWNKNRIFVKKYIFYCITSLGV